MPSYLMTNKSNEGASTYNMLFEYAINSIPIGSISSTGCCKVTASGELDKTGPIK